MTVWSSAWPNDCTETSHASSFSLFEIVTKERARISPADILLILQRIALRLLVLLRLALRRQPLARLLFLGFELAQIILWLRACSGHSLSLSLLFLCNHTTGSLSAHSTGSGLPLSDGKT